MKTEIHISEITVAQYRKLSAVAKEIEDKLSQLLGDTAQADIPDEVKLKIMKWLERADTFCGLSYMLTPQPEWMGGDSQDPANFKLRAPHIAR